MQRSFRTSAQCLLLAGLAACGGGTGVAPETGADNLSMARAADEGPAFEPGPDPVSGDDLTAAPLSFAASPARPVTQPQAQGRASRLGTAQALPGVAAIQPQAPLLSAELKAALEKLQGGSALGSAAARAAPQGLPTWVYKPAVAGTTANVPRDANSSNAWRLLGADPAKSTAVTEITIPIIPVRILDPQGVVLLDATGPAKGLRTRVPLIDQIKQSPIFQAYPFKVNGTDWGTGQLLDVYARANAGVPMTSTRYGLRVKYKLLPTLDITPDGPVGPPDPNAVAALGPHPTLQDTYYLLRNAHQLPVLVYLDRYGHLFSPNELPVFLLPQVVPDSGLTSPLRAADDPLSPDVLHGEFAYIRPGGEKQLFSIVTAFDMEGQNAGQAIDGIARSLLQWFLRPDVPTIYGIGGDDGLAHGCKMLDWNFGEATAVFTAYRDPTLYPAKTFKVRGGPAGGTYTLPDAALLSWFDPPARPAPSAGPRQSLTGALTAPCSLLQ